MSDRPANLLTFVIDGQDYPFAGDLTPRELGFVKKLSGVRAGELEDALASGDAEVIVALAAIAARRAGQEPNVDAMLDGKATIDVRTDAVPPLAGDEASPSSPSTTTP